MALAAAAWLAPAPGQARPKAPAAQVQGSGAPSYATRAEARRFADRGGRAPRAGPPLGAAPDRAGAPHHRRAAADDAGAARRGEELGRLPRALRRAAAHRRRRRVLARQPGLAGPRAGRVRRAAGDRRRHHRRRDLLRPPDRAASASSTRWRRWPSTSPSGATTAATTSATSSRTSSSGAARERRDPLAVKGSFAGAIGLPQFMPGSITKHAIDFDGDGHVDLAGSSADAIGSVAHYLAEFGWQRGLPPTLGDVTPPADPAAARALLAPDIVPSFSAGAVRRARRPARRRRRRRPTGPARAGRAAERRRRAELRRRHDELLRDHALQPVELLRDGGDRARRRDPRRALNGRRAAARRAVEDHRPAAAACRLTAFSGTRSGPSAPARSTRCRSACCRSPPRRQGPWPCRCGSTVPALPARAAPAP